MYRSAKLQVMGPINRKSVRTGDNCTKLGITKKNISIAVRIQKDAGCCICPMASRKLTVK